MDTLCTTLDAWIGRYVTHQRALGRSCKEEAWVLRTLARFVAAHQADDLSSTLFEAWCRSQQHLSANTRHQRQRIARDLCRYRQRFETTTCFVPEAQRVPAHPSHAVPVLFGPDAVTKLLAAAGTLGPRPCSPLRAHVMRLAVVLLYTAGLRRQELVRLSLGDVDVQTGVLRIRASKFYKSRLVPLSADARDELKRYLEQRLRLAPHPDPDEPLLGHQRRGGGLRAYSGGGLGTSLHSLFVQAGVRDVQGRIPRVHDYRHVFAIEALLRWYREGADVQVLLPKLALYMGHVSIASTQYYLRFVPPLAEAASTRFDAHFGHLIQGGAS
jgi:integrase/recombinase XerD